MSYDHALSVDAIAPDLAFESGANFVERNDGTAHLFGRVARVSAPDQRFLVDIAFDGGSSTGVPVTSLDASVYSSSGGAIDPSSWRYYGDYHGTLTGLDAMKGVVVTITSQGSLQVGAGANNRNLNFGASGDVVATISGAMADGTPLPSSSSGDIAVDLDDDITRCTRAADGDPTLAVWPTQHAFILLGGLGDFVFSAPGTFEEYDDGTARLFGWLEHVDDADDRFYVDFTMSSRVDPGAPNYPPTGSPKIELQNSALAINGGPINPNTWHYYLVVNGTLTGAGDYEGAVLNATRTGPALQVGYGASNKNDAFGLSSWLHFSTVTQPNSGSPLKDEFDGDLNLDAASDCRLWVDEAEANAASLYSGGFLMTLFGVGDDFVSVLPGDYIEHGDGTATLEATIARKANPDEMFHVSFTFSDRVDPIDANYPPQGSPKKELASSAYAVNGGPIDTSTWHYFLTTEGTFTGLGDLDGAVLTATRLGPAFQVGLGASGKNFAFGGSGWLDVTLVSQPVNAAPLPSNFQADLNADMETECPPQAGDFVSYGAGTPGTGMVAPCLDLLGVPANNDPVILRLRDGLGGSPAILALGPDAAANVLPTGNICLLESFSIVVGPFMLTNGLAGDGVKEMHWTAPSVPAGSKVALQGFVIDPLAVGGISLTNGILVETP